MATREELIEKIKANLDSYMKMVEQGTTPQSIDFEFEKGVIQQWQTQVNGCLDRLYVSLLHIFNFLDDLELERLSKKLDQLNNKIDSLDKDPSSKIDNIIEYIKSIPKDLKLSYPVNRINYDELNFLSSLCENVKSPIYAIGPDELDSIDKNILDSYIKDYVDLYNTNFIEDDVSKNIIRQIITNKLDKERPPNINSSLIDEILKEIQVFKEERSTMDQEIKDTVNDLNKKISNFTNEAIIKTYQEESDELRESISLYTGFIILLFVSIIILVLSKIIVLSKLQSDFDINEYKSIAYFLSLVVSISALLTYLIKEKNRLTSLHDEYRRVHLELSSLPQYSFRLSDAQRNELTMSLANNYFTGLNSNKLSNENNFQDSILFLKTLNDVVKNINDKAQK